MPSTAENRQAPRVPNHEMVRSIGRGSYGEIWLARSLTGTWRAVKIVDRRTFESDKAFQREFEGMAKFEPISRDDAGFVDILHVGRDEAGGFFYYVMELADDHLGCGVIDPATYVPKTIKAELSRRSRLLADECITIGLSLTKALGALHRQDLVHRDIKPANIIFVGGVPKIADIGLVAASGQDSYVGTEGYVPPEGPGTAQADIYSLGKVLYEMAMGKDRMDFPAVNSELSGLPDKAALMQLNGVLLRACANDPEQRYATAEEMHEDLLRLRDGRPLRARLRRRGPLLAGLATMLLLGSGGAYTVRQQMARGTVHVETDPPEAMVVFAGTMRRSPADYEQLRPGKYGLRVMLAGYEPVDTPFEIKAGQQTRIPLLHLVRSLGTVELLSRPPGAAYEIRNGLELVRSGTTPETIENLPTGNYQLTMQLDTRTRSDTLEIKRGEAAMKEMEFASGVINVVSRPAGAEILLDGKRAGVAPLEIKTPEGEHRLLAKYHTWPDQQMTVKARPDEPYPATFEFPSGSVKITSSPSGAIVWEGTHDLGTTPRPLDDLEPGKVHYVLRLPGFKDKEVFETVKPGEQTFVGVHFDTPVGPRRGEPWTNTLGMKFVPVGDILMGIWPVRVQDYDAFCAATKRVRPIPDFAQDSMHPVVRVNWEDGTAFCEWLTQKEIAEKKIVEGQSYRLPTDLEWSAGVGLPDEGRNTPEERDGKLKEFPWGKQWPPPPGAGNFADSPTRRGGFIPGYHDGFPQTSPVGSFPANRFGLFDMAGNVWQWCRDPYKGVAVGPHDWGVLRGGSWGTATQSELHSSYRNALDRTERDVTFGFRCVLVPDSDR